MKTATTAPAARDIPGGSGPFVPLDGSRCANCHRLVLETWDEKSGLCVQCALERFFFDREARWERALGARAADAPGVS